MREITFHKQDKEISLNNSVLIFAADDTDKTGVNRKYNLCLKLGIEGQQIGRIEFQKGPYQQTDHLPEALYRANGITNETLLAILIDRLQSIQKNSTLACKESDTALTHLEKAMTWLHKRAKDRQTRNVEGQNKK